jgi:cyclophilin family peptidyl-prolyl cis-trans isomerase
MLAGVAAIVLFSLAQPVAAPSARFGRQLDRCKQQLDEVASQVARASDCTHYAEGAMKRWIRTREALQASSRALLIAEFGSAVRPRIVELTLQLPSEAQTRSMQIEMASDADMPVTVLYFLRQVKIGVWNGAKFHRNAGHVLQAGPGDLQKLSTLGERSVPFQEYSASWPHQRLTVGLAGRPGGPDFYISTVDNTHNHGPGSQNEDAKLFNEADPCFGKVIRGFEVVDAMRALPTVAGPFGSLREPIKIISAVIG